MDVAAYTDELLVYDIANPELLCSDYTVIKLSVDKYREYAETARRFHQMQDELKLLYARGRKTSWGVLDK